MIKYEPIKYENAKQIAVLHIAGIKTGFISSLGIDFVTALYQAVTHNKTSFGFAAMVDEQVIGFVVFAANLKRLYKSVILSQGFHFVWILFRSMFSFNRTKKILETLFYPAKINQMKLPPAELLSIVVAEDERGKGVAEQLVRRGLTECAKRGIFRVKVLVGAGNEPANRLYLRCAFELARQIDNHGVISNIYVAETSPSDDVHSTKSE